MAELSDREIEEAAAEAGISPHELRRALADARPDALARRDASTSLGPPSRGASSRHAEHLVPLLPSVAVRSVRASIERQTGHKGHQQSEAEADIVDEERGLTYRIRAESDGAGGSLVRVDVDSSTAAARRIMLSVIAFTMAGLTLPFMLLFGMKLLFLMGVVGLGAAGFIGFGALAVAERRALSEAQGIAATALVEAEERATLRAALAAGEGNP